jgi:hypothetical protein
VFFHCPAYLNVSPITLKNFCCYSLSFFIFCNSLLMLLNYLLRLFFHLFLRVFIIAFWSIFTTAALKSLAENFNILSGLCWHLLSIFIQFDTFLAWQWSTAREAFMMPFTHRRGQWLRQAPKQTFGNGTNSCD